MKGQSPRWWSIFDSLRVRLLLVIAIVLAVAGTTAALLASRAITERFQGYVQNREVEGRARRSQLETMLPGILSALYAREDSWDGIHATLEELGTVSEERIILTDASGEIVADSANLPITTSDLPIDAGMSLVVEDGRVGTFYVMPMPAVSSSGEAAYIRSINRSLLWAMSLAGALAFVLTMALSRRILAPIEALKTAVRKMEAGDLNQRVEVVANDEIGELAAAFNAMADSLARIEQLRRNMVSDVAHELRTPLSNIRGYLEAIQDGLVEPTDAVIDSLYEEAMLLNRLVNDLQELALAEAGQLRLVRQPVAFGELVERSAQAAQHLVNGSGIEFSVDVPRDLPEVEIDAERIGQVMRNLLSNAFTYTPKGGVVSVRVRHEEEKLCVHVFNTGDGIDPEHLPYLFERFYRVDRSRSRATGGSGLGLAIVKQLVEAHGGEVWAENDAGRGVTFSFSLPICAAPSPAR